LHNLTGDPGHHFVAEGLVEDLIEALSRVPTLFVISRLSTLAFRNQDRHPHDIGNILGVRYVLSGSVRIIGDHLRWTIELTDTQLGAALWFSKLDERVFDLFEVQDHSSEMIVRQVAPHVHAAEMNRIRVKRPDSLEAYDLFLRAQENMHNSSRTVFETSEALFDAAIAKDPYYASALAWRAYWHVLRVGQGWSPDPAHDTIDADRFARLAVECDSMEPMAFAVHRHVASYLHKDFDLAFRRFETALRINANAAPAWLWSAAARAWTGNGSRAIEEVNKAMALSPYAPLMFAYNSVAAMAYLADGQYERAIEYARQSLRENRTYTGAYRQLVMALVLAGREDEAETSARQLLELEPDLTVEGFRRRYPGSGSPPCQPLVRGARKSRSSARVTAMRPHQHQFSRPTVARTLRISWFSLFRAGVGQPRAARVSQGAPHRRLGSTGLFSYPFEGTSRETAAGILCCQIRWRPGPTLASSSATPAPGLPAAHPSSQHRLVWP
jgi:adenylate cyclase